MIQVPLYDTFGAEAVEFIIKHSNINIIYCSSSKLAALAEVLPKVKQQVVQVQHLSRNCCILIFDGEVPSCECTELFPCASSWEALCRWWCGARSQASLLMIRSLTCDPQTVHVFSLRPARSSHPNRK